MRIDKQNTTKMLDSIGLELGIGYEDVLKLRLPQQKTSSQYETAPHDVAAAQKEAASHNETVSHNETFLSAIRPCTYAWVS